MSLQEDFENFKVSTNGGVKEYMRLLWDETELEAEQFEEVYDFTDSYSIIEIMIELLEQIDGSTPFRKNMYRAFLARLEEDPEFTAWLAYLSVYINSEEVKREYLAKFMTRVLRGELCNDYRRSDEASAILKGRRIPVWEQAKLRLETLCVNLGIA